MEKGFLRVWCCNATPPLLFRTVVRIVSQRCSIVVGKLADRTTSRSTIPAMMNTTTLTPPGAPFTVSKAHDPEDNFTAYEIEANGQTIELEPSHVEQLARVLTRIAGGN